LRFRVRDKVRVDVRVSVFYSLRHLHPAEACAFAIVMMNYYLIYYYYYYVPIPS